MNPLQFYLSLTMLHDRCTLTSQSIPLTQAHVSPVPSLDIDDALTTPSPHRRSTCNMSKTSSTSSTSSTGSNNTSSGLHSSVDAWRKGLPDQASKDKAHTSQQSQDAMQQYQQLKNAMYSKASGKK